ncbi:ROK family protein [Streptomyces sp. DSM 41982]|uniref:ROK family protein n=3 Tax=Streptomyces TaxID=1883 RepID=A0ABD5E5B7_9ACTN|nr:ROK family protein [Streptomyces sp. DSM 41982]MDT0415485.1 ROK family protein [Streptomyces sp. DSM 41982]
MAHERTPLRLVPSPARASGDDGGAAGLGALGAVEVLPGRVRAALLSGAGVVRERADAVFDPAAGAGAVDAALAEVAGLLAAGAPLGVGVAAAGVVDPGAGLVVEVNEAPALRGYPVARRLEALVGAPVRVEHRARVQVLGDRWFGPGRGRRSFASVSTGEVLGVGILYAGEVLAPPGGRSGAHMTVSASGRRCTCGRRGCWKTVATTRWLRERARALGLGGDVTLGALVAAPGEEAARLVGEYAENLVLGLATVQQLFACGLFVLHGEAREGGERFRALVEERLRADVLGGGEPVRVVVSEAAVDDVALLGAAGLVLSGR